MTDDEIAAALGPEPPRDDDDIPPMLDRARRPQEGTPTVVQSPKRGF